LTRGAAISKSPSGAGNEFLKEHGKMQELEKQVAALTAGLQKVTAELETLHPDSGVAISQE